MTAPSTVDLFRYQLLGRFDLPEPTRTAAPLGNLMAQEASAVTYDWDRDSLFVLGDGGTAIVQISKTTGALIDTMTLAPGSSPQGTDFYDPEGLTYIGAGLFVLVEERDRQAVQFTYQPGTILTRSDTKTVKLGVTIGNIGLEGVSWDPYSGGYVFVKEISPEGIFQASINFDAGTASNGSPTTVNSVNLFDPALAGLLDFADVFALSNLPYLAPGSQYQNLLILSQEEGKVVNISRTGVISSYLQLQSAPGVSINLADQQHEGLAMDRDGFLYIASENGGGDFNHPQLWIYGPSFAPNLAPTALNLVNAVTQINENTSTSARLRVADLQIVDDGLGDNRISLVGPDATYFEVVGNGLFIKAGTVLDYETKWNYQATVQVDDPTVGSNPDASANYSLNLINIVDEAPALPTVYVSEVAPWSSGNSPFSRDWFELTNGGGSPLLITGWKMDDNSNLFSAAVPLAGITTIAPGESVVFMELQSTDTLLTKQTEFINTWFSGVAPAGLQIGSYTGSGVGLSTGGDAVNIYNSLGDIKANVTFGNSPAGPFPTFNNALGLNNANLVTLSSIGVNGAFKAPGDLLNTEVGSPGTVGRAFVSEVAPWASGNSLIQRDWFEFTNTTAREIDLAGWRMDDNSGSFAASVPLVGISSVKPGESVIFIELTGTDVLADKKAAFLAEWFGATPPADLKIGNYSGSGVGLSTGADAVNLYDATGLLRTTVAFGSADSSVPFQTFDNRAAVTTVSQLSSLGVNGAFGAVGNSGNEIGSPGGIGAIMATYNFSSAIFDAVEGTNNNALTYAKVRVNRSGDLSGAGSVQVQFNGGTAFGAAAAPAEGTLTGVSSSASPYILPRSGSGVQVRSLLTVGDAVGAYVMAGIPDGLGAFDNGDGTFTLLMNQEISNSPVLLGATRAHGGKAAFVSSWTINKSDLSIVSGSDLIREVYLWDSATQQSKSTANSLANGNGINFNRFCSADLPPVSALYNAATGLGTQARLFLNGEEGGSTGFALANVASGVDKGKTYVLGKFNPSTNGSGLTAVGGWENLLANPFAQDKTIVIGNNDGGTGILSNAVAVYVGTKTNSGTEADKAGLTNGQLKFINVTGNAAEIVNSTTRATNIASGTRFNLSGTASTAFSRPEDGVWDPLDPKKYYFVTTDRLDTIIDGIGTQVGTTRLWRLNFDDITNPDLGGTIDLLIDGDIVNGKKANMFDNITIDKSGHILLQEDVGNALHNGKIWQYDTATDSLKLLANHDPSRFGDIGMAATLPFNIDEESSGVIDMQDILGPGMFLLVDQAHYAIDDPLQVEGGQLLSFFNPSSYQGLVDYINTSQVVNFAPGEAFKDVLVPVFADTRLEGSETISLALTAASTGSQIGTTQATAQLVVADVNPTPIALAVDQTSINENSPAGSLIGHFSTTSPLNGVGFGYALVKGIGDADNAFFAIVGDTLKIIPSPDYETKPTYSVRVRSTQEGGAFIEKALIITVNDINDIALITGSGLASVTEGTAVDALGRLGVTGSLAIADQDLGQAFFNTAVIANPGNRGQLTMSASGSYSYTVDNALPAIQQLKAGESLTDIFTVSSLDGSATRQIAITINGASAGFNGVASGDVSTDRVTLWTRTYDLADSTMRRGLTESLQVQVALAPTFASPVVIASGATGNFDNDYTAKFNLTGLAPDNLYYYRMMTAAGEISATGSFRTAPAADSTRSIKFAHSGDLDGYMRPYLAMQNMASEKLDFFLLDGDTIYETASNSSAAAPTTPNVEANPTPANLQALEDGYHRKYLENLLPAPGGSYTGLTGFFAAQAIVPLPDNHEFGNKEIINGGAPLALKALNFNGSTSLADDVNRTGTYINDSASFETLLQAYLDYMPIKQPDTIVAPSDQRSDGEAKLYSSQQWGKNALVINIDDRTFRDVRLNKINSSGARVDDTGSRAANPERTMLGATQLAWLKDQLLAAKASGTTWTFINLTSPIDQIGAIGSGDDGGKSWMGGYRAERNELLKFIADNGIKNVVFMACDDHLGRINELLYSPTGQLDDQSSYKVLEGVISIVDGPMGATGPDQVTDHSFANIKALADQLVNRQLAAGVNPVGLDPLTTSGLSNVWRAGDATAAVAPKPVDFLSLDTFNYAVLEVTSDGILNVALRGIDSYPVNSFPSPSALNQPKDILRFSIDGNIDKRPVVYQSSAPSGVIYEGDSLSFKITRQDLSIGPKVYWQLSGPGINAADFVDGKTLGSVAFGADGIANFTTSLVRDNMVEGEEALEVRFFSDAALTQQVGPTGQMLIKETSLTVATDGRDQITGTIADETLSGVPLGSLLKGRGTIDQLIGGGGNDRFLLGDASGRFYDDGDNATSGSTDYAFIKDFAAGDLIQLAGRASDYILGTARVEGFTGTAIYARNPLKPVAARVGPTDEWIGFVQSIDNLPLNLANASQFSFV
jgi:VCBS repeat-containing protein